MIRLNKIAKQDGRYNYGHKIYQSIYFQGKEVVKGVRDNVLERAKIIGDENIKGKVIVDIGCNIGASCILALEAGAKKVYGFDVREENIKIAKSIAQELGLDITYEVRDFRQKQKKKGDVAFCFSVDKYIKHSILAENLSRYKIVYFETHNEGWLSNTIRDEFSFVKRIGELKKYGTSRKLYLMKNE